MVYIYLLLAIVTEVIGTAALKQSEGFTKLYPSVVVIIGYGCAFFFFSLVLKSMPMGLAYAIWSALGIVLMTLAGFVLFGQKVDMAAVIGLTFIISGVIVIHVFSQSVHQQS